MYKGENVDHWSLKCFAAYESISSKLEVGVVLVVVVVFVDVEAGLGRCCE